MQPFVIPVKGLKAGSNHYDWHADGEFFKTFETSEILDADLQIAVDVDYQESSIEVKCHVEGNVTVICDRCLEDLTLPVDTSFLDDDFEVTDQIDLGQDIYDYVCISLPMQRIHPNDGCNPETLKYLNK